MSKLEFILKFGHFSKDPLGRVGCSDEHIIGHYNQNITVGKNKEEAAQLMVQLYDKIVSGNDNSLNKKDLWAIGWSTEGIEVSTEKIKNIYLSMISSSEWLLTKTDLAPIGREYFFKEFLPSTFWIEFYKKYFTNKTPTDYQEVFLDIRTIEDDSSFEFFNYTKKDCIREGFFQVYPHKTLDELKMLLKQIRQE